MLLLNEADNTILNVWEVLLFVYVVGWGMCCADEITIRPVSEAKGSDQHTYLDVKKNLHLENVSLVDALWTVTAPDINIVLHPAIPSHTVTLHYDAIARDEALALLLEEHDLEMRFKGGTIILIAPKDYFKTSEVAFLIAKNCIGFIPHHFRLEYVDPYALVEILRSYWIERMHDTLEKGVCGKEHFVVEPFEREIGAQIQPEHLPALKMIVDKLDMLEWKPLVNDPAQQSHVFSAIDDMLAHMPPHVQYETVLVRISHSTPEHIAHKIKKHFYERALPYGVVMPDKGTQTVIIQDTRENIEIIKELILNFDN